VLHAACARDISGGTYFRFRTAPLVGGPLVSVWAEMSWVGLVVASLLLAVSGALKVRHPASVEPLLAVLRVPAVLRRGRVVGAAEVCLGSAALITAAQPLIILEAATFAFFAIVIGYVLAARVPLSSCGCAGARRTPPSPIHIGVNVVAAGAAAFAAGAQPASVAAMWPGLEWYGIPSTVGMIAAVGLLLVVIGPLADLLQACARIRAAGVVYRHPQRSEARHDFA
jgi:hypothetical protein